MTNRLIAVALLAIVVTACGKEDASYDAAGVFETTDVIVSAKSAGEIKRLDVEEGMLVEAGAQLGYIDTAQLHLQKGQLAATRRSTTSRELDTRTQVASIEQQIANLQRERTRAEELYRENAGTRKAVDDIDYQIKVLNRQLAAAREQVSANNSSLAEQGSSITAQTALVNEQIGNAVIVSPIKGTILTKYAEPGEYATPGRALFKVGDMDDMRLRAYITADQLTGIKSGQDVTVFADRGTADRQSYQGTIVWISDKAEFTPKTIQTRDERSNLVYAIKIAVKNDGMIKRGMYGEVKF